MQTAYEVTSPTKTMNVAAGYPLAAAQAIHDATGDIRLTIKNIETGTVCLVDFDLVQTWKDII